MLTTFFLVGVCGEVIFGVLGGILGLGHLGFAVLALVLILISPLFIYLPLLLIQRPIRFHNAHAIAGYRGRRRLTKVEVISIVLVATCVIGSLVYHSTWREFHAPDLSFSVMLPPAPEQTLGQELPIQGSDLTTRYDFYSKEDLRGDVYSIEVLNWPPEAGIVPSQEALEDFLADMFSEKGERITSSEAIVWHEYPALDFAVQQDSEHWKGKIIATERTWYVLMLHYKGICNKKKYSKFIHSFKLHTGLEHKLCTQTARDLSVT